MHDLGRSRWYLQPTSRTDHRHYPNPGPGDRGTVSTNPNSAPPAPFPRRPRQTATWAELSFSPARRFILARPPPPPQQGVTHTGRGRAGRTGRGRARKRAEIVNSVLRWRRVASYWANSAHTRRYLRTCQNQRGPRSRALASGGAGHELERSFAVCATTRYLQLHGPRDGAGQRTSRAPPAASVQRGSAVDQPAMPPTQ